MNNQHNRPLRVFLGIVVAFVLLVGGLAYMQSFRKLSLTFENAGDTTTTVYHLTKSGKQDSEKQVANKDQTIRLKKGKYRITTKGEGYEEKSTEVDLSSNPASITVSPNFSQQRLAKMLTAESLAILLAINTQIPETLSAQYSIAPGRLYKQGEWYGTTISPAVSAEEARLNYFDTYRLIAKKTNNTWTVLTLPPEIILSQPKYPEIPREVLVDINKNPN